VAMREETAKALVKMAGKVDFSSYCRKVLEFHVRQGKGARFSTVVDQAEAAGWTSEELTQLRALVDELLLRGGGRG